MKPTLRGRILLAVLVGLAFCAILFQDILILIAFIVLGVLLLGEALWMKIVTLRPEKWFGASNLESNFDKRIYPGEVLGGKFLFTKRGSGTLSISSDLRFLKINPDNLESSERSKEIQLQFKTPFAGEYFVRKLNLSLLGPLRLVQGSCAVPLSLKFTVIPRVIQAAITSSRLLAGRSGIGETPVNLPGIGTEFYEMRGYQIGDDYRQINWKASARWGELIINERMKEVGGSYYIVLETRARDYFERDRLATTFLQIANTLTMSRSKFGVVIHDGENVLSVKRVEIPEKSLSFALGIALDFVDVKQEDLPEELTAVASSSLLANRRMASEMRLEVVDQIEEHGRLSLQGSVTLRDVYSHLIDLVREERSEPPEILYVSGLESSLSEEIEFGATLKRKYGANFILIDPTMPWVVEASEREAYEAYLKFASKLRALELSRTEYAVGDPSTVISKL